MKKLLVSLSILFSVIVFFPLRADTAETAIQTDIAVIKTEIQNLSGKIDGTFKTLDGKIDDKFNTLDGKIDGTFKALDGKIDDKFNTLDGKIDGTFKALDGKIDDKFKALEKRFDSLEKNFDRQNTLIIACIAIPMALITLMIAWRSIKDNSLQKQIDTLSEIIESQKQQLTERSPQS